MTSEEYVAIYKGRKVRILDDAYYGSIGAVDSVYPLQGAIWVKLDGREKPIGVFIKDIELLNREPLPLPG